MNLPSDDARTKALNEQTNETEERRSALSLLARADVDVLAAAWAAIPGKPTVEVLRQPEFGLVMARGRIGGGGGAFNLGEVTVTRAAIQLSSGETGYGHVLGRDRRRAHLVACFDALWQNPNHRSRVEETVIRLTARRTAETDATTNGKTAATRVNFFTMVRGEDV